MTTFRRLAARTALLMLMPALAACDGATPQATPATPPAPEAGGAPEEPSAKPAPTAGAVPVDEITKENARRELERIKRDLDDEDG